LNGTRVEADSAARNAFGAIHIVKAPVFIATILVIASPLLCREINTEEPVTITGQLFVANSFVYITTNDTVSGKGNGVELRKEPVHRFVVSIDALAPDRQASRAAERKRLAATGKPVTLKGAFHALAFKGAEYYHCKAQFELSE
jgi:hypothetical protein